MLYVAIGQLLVIGILVFALLVRELHHDAAVKWMVETEALERDKLLQRIQHPDREPVVRSAAAAPPPDLAAQRERRHEVSEEHKANLAKVGTVATTD
jgi:hypothetical protein